MKDKEARKIINELLDKLGFECCFLYSILPNKIRRYSYINSIVEKVEILIEAESKTAERLSALEDYLKIEYKEEETKRYVKKTKN